MLQCSQSEALSAFHSCSSLSLTTRMDAEDQKPAVSLGGNELPWRRKRVVSRWVFGSVSIWLIGFWLLGGTFTKEVQSMSAKGASGLPTTLLTFSTGSTRWTSSTSGKSTLCVTLPTPAPQSSALVTALPFPLVSLQRIFSSAQTPGSALAGGTLANLLRFLSRNNREPIESIRGTVPNP